MPGKIRKIAMYHNTEPLGLSRVENCLRMPGVLAYALESTQAGKSPQKQHITMTAAPRSIFCIFQLYRIRMAEAMSQDKIKVIQRGLLLVFLGYGSTMPEISIADNAGLKSTNGNDSPTTFWLPGNIK